MADRVDFYPNQKVTQAELDKSAGYAEAAERNARVDDNIYGVIKGLVASLSGASSVQVTSGIAIDQFGKRIKAFTDGAANKVQSYATDTANVATTVTNGNERWISIYAAHGRQALDPRVSNTVFFDQPECLHNRTVGELGTAGLGGTGVDKFLVVQGVMAPTGTAVRPALLPDAVLICDVLRTFNDASNVIDTTTRRQVFGITDTAQPSAGNGLAIIMSALTTWAGGRTFPPQPSLNAALSKIITDLAATAAGDDGAERIGAAASGNLTAGTIRTQLDELDAEKAALAIANTWGGTQLYNAKITVTPTTATAAINAPASGQGSGTRKLLMEIPFASGSSNPFLRVYLDYIGFGNPSSWIGNSAAYSRSLLITLNAKWDGANWSNDDTRGFGTNGDVSAAYAIALLGTVTSGPTNENTAGPGFVLMKRPAQASPGTWADSGWTQRVDAAAWLDANNAAFTTPNYSGSGLNRWNWLNGEMVIGMTNCGRTYTYGVTGYANASMTARQTLSWYSKYTGAPSSVTVTPGGASSNITGGTHAASVSANHADITGTVTAAGTYFLTGTIQAQL